MMRLIMLLIRLYLRGLRLFSSRLAGRRAFRIFCTPRFRKRVPAKAVEIMGRAEGMALEIDSAEGEGVEIRAYRWPAKEASAKRVLLIHGWESRAGRLAVWVDPLLEAGFEVIAFDAPAHGEAPGKRTNPVDFALAVHALEATLGPLHGLVAHSMGCLGAALAYGGGFILGREDLVLERLVFIAGAESSQGAMAEFCQALGLGEKFPKLVWDAAAEKIGYPMEELAGHRLLAKHEAPILWIHDPEDPEVSIQEAETVAATCPHVELERVSGLGHHRIVREPSVIARGVEFLQAS